MATVVLDPLNPNISTRRPRGAPSPRALRGFDAINFLPRVGLRRFSLPPSTRRAFPRALRGFDAINFLPRVGFRRFSLPPVSREGSTHDVIPHSPHRFKAFFPPRFHACSLPTHNYDVIPYIIRNNIYFFKNDVITKMT